LPRNPKASAYYRCVEDHFEQVETVWDDRYQSRFGFWRPYVTDVIRRYLDCGDLHFGFVRVKCEDCGHEYLLVYSCNYKIQVNLSSFTREGRGGNIEHRTSNIEY